MRFRKETSHSYYPNQRAMALLVDADNFAHYIKKEQHLACLVSSLKPWGKIVVKRAFFRSPSSHHSCQDFFKLNGFEIVSCGTTRTKKNAADIQMAVEAIEIIHTMPGIQTFAIASGDSDFISLIRKLQAYQCAVIGIGKRHNSSPELRKTCNTFLFIEDILGSLVVQPKPFWPVRSLKTGEKDMKTVLRKHNLYPPDPVKRREILQTVYSLNRELAFPCLLPDIQEQLFRKMAHQPPYSKTMIRTLVRTLARTGVLFAGEKGPHTRSPIARIPTPEVMEQAVAQLQLRALWEASDVIADPLTITRVIFADVSKANKQQIEQMIASLRESNHAVSKKNS